MNPITEYFARLRIDPNLHLGCGDIRLSIGLQEEVAALWDADARIDANVDAAWKRAGEGYRPRSSIADQPTHGLTPVEVRQSVLNSPCPMCNNLAKHQDQCAYGEIERRLTAALAERNGLCERCKQLDEASECFRQSSELANKEANELKVQLLAIQAREAALRTALERALPLVSLDCPVARMVMTEALATPADMGLLDRVKDEIEHAIVSLQLATDEGQNQTADKLSALFRELTGNPQP